MFLVWVVGDKIKLSADPFLFFSRRKNWELLLFKKKKKKKCSTDRAREKALLTYLSSHPVLIRPLGSRDATKENNSSFLFYRELLW